MEITACTGIPPLYKILYFASFFSAAGASGLASDVGDFSSGLVSFGVSCLGDSGAGFASSAFSIF